MPLSNLSPVPSLQSLILPPANSGLIQQRSLHFGCLGSHSFLQAVGGSSFRADSNNSPATVSGLPIPTFELSMVQTKALSNGPLQPYGTDCTAMGIFSLFSCPRDQKSRKPATIEIASRRQLPRLELRQ